MKRIFLSLLLLGLLGCSKKSSPISNATLTPPQIIQVMTDINVGTMDYIVSSATYSLPSREFIENEYSSGLRKFFNDLNFTYSKGDQDCRSFALGATFYVDHLHHIEKDKIQNSALAFGEFYYQKEGADGGGHAINVVITKDSNKYLVLFYEPQTYSIVILSKTEIESCEFYRF